MCNEEASPWLTVFVITAAFARSAWLLVRRNVGGMVGRTDKYEEGSRRMDGVGEEHLFIVALSRNTKTEWGMASFGRSRGLFEPVTHILRFWR